MDDFDFQWDAEKAIANSKKHGISFDEAKTVFSDALARLTPVPDSSHGEERFIILGESIVNRLLIVWTSQTSLDSLLSQKVRFLEFSR